MVVGTPRGGRDHRQRCGLLASSVYGAETVNWAAQARGQDAVNLVVYPLLLVPNPVWVLDLGIVLPAMILTGLLLRGDRPLGYVLAAPLLVFGVVMGVAIVGMFIALTLAGEPSRSHRPS